jgi:hypothetical protein
MGLEPCFRLFGEVQSCAGMVHELRQLVVFLSFDRHWPKVFAVKLQQVERVSLNVLAPIAMVFGSAHLFEFSGRDRN